MKKYYLENISDVFSAVESTPNGLGGAQASQRLARDGKNKLEEAKKKSLLRRFIEQLLNPMILVLIGAAVVSAVTASLSHEKEGYADVIIILVVVILNAVLGVYQESKAEKAIEALQKMAAATSKVPQLSEAKRSDERVQYRSATQPACSQRRPLRTE